VAIGSHCCQYCRLLPGAFGFNAKLILWAFLLTSFGGCISDIDIQPTEKESLYVVEGWIEQGGYAHVLITHTVDNTSTIGLADLFELIVSDAQVTLRTDDEEELLLLVKDTMYTAIPIYRGFKIVGEIGKSYTLEVKIGDQLFTSTDNLLAPVRPDSLWFIPEPGKNGGGIIHVSLTDPPEYGNYYRLVAKRLGIDDDYSNLSGNILDDHLFNGKVINFPVIRSGASLQEMDDSFFYPGQTVVVKTCMLTVERLQYFLSVSNQLGSVLSPLSIQSRTITLMEGGALGGWSCFGVCTDTIKIE